MLFAEQKKRTISLILVGWFYSKLNIVGLFNANVSLIIMASNYIHNKNL